MKNIFSHQSVDEIVSQIDQFEDLSYRIVEKFFKKHNFEEEFYRLEEGRYIGVGKQRILTRLCLEFMDGSWSKVVGFYERCNRENDEPHYEDLATSLMVAFVATAAVELTKFMVISKLKPYLAKKPTHMSATKKDVKMIFYAPIKYVFLGTALREQNRQSEISDRDFSITNEEYKTILGELRKLLDETTNSYSVEGIVSGKAVENFQQYCKLYFSQHGFISDDPIEELFEEMIRYLEEELQQHP